MLPEQKNPSWLFFDTASMGITLTFAGSCLHVAGKKASVLRGFGEAAASSAAVGNVGKNCRVGKHVSELAGEIVGEQSMVHQVVGLPYQEPSGGWLATQESPL